LGAPKKAVRDPCLSFFGVEEDTAAEIEDVAFLLALMVDGKGQVPDRREITRPNFRSGVVHQPRGMKLATQLTRSISTFNS
jgi:hypothetical protein